MKIKYIIKCVFLSVLAGSFYTCENELDLSPISQETSQNAYTRGSQLEAALTGVYESFQSSQYYVWDHVLLQDVRSDNHYAGGDNPEIFAIDYFNITPTNTRIFDAWSSIYRAISKANLVLEKAPLITEDLTNERRNQIMGEAYFLRAYNYYHLVKMFGGVPLYLETIKSTDPSEVRKPRETTERVYEQIIEDLELALDLLPHTYGNDSNVNKARATKGAANALLAKAYAQQPVPNYPKVIEHANNVINSPAGYDLMGNYDNLFDGNNENNIESILEVQYLGGDEGNWGPQMHLPPSLSGDSWRKFVTPSHNLINAFDAEGDVVRKNATVYFETINNWVDEFWGNAIGSSIPFAYKWRTAGGWASPNNEYIFRLADILLLKAEALNQSGQSGEAAVIVNRIRQRVGLDDLPAVVQGSQPAMKEAILKERRLELAQESTRWDDLVRNGVAVQVMNSVSDMNLATGSPVNYNISTIHLLLPIPQNEINRNPNLEQNPGYN